jgi:hypothetical protein
MSGEFDHARGDGWERYPTLIEYGGEAEILRKSEASGAK